MITKPAGTLFSKKHQKNHTSFQLRIAWCEKHHAVLGLQPNKKYFFGTVEINMLPVIVDILATIILSKHNKLKGMSTRSGYYIADQYAAHFLTFTTVGWVDVFTRNACRDIFINSLKFCCTDKGLIVHAYVIMSNHVHLILRAEEGSAGLSSIVRDLKKFTSKEIVKWILENPKEKRRDWLELVFKYHAKYNKKNTTYQFWQQSNQPMLCQYPKFTGIKLNYIHNNPVKAGIVDRPEDYLFSSARNYLERSDCILEEVTVIDFGVQEGFVMV